VCVFACVVVVRVVECGAVRVDSGVEVAGLVVMRATQSRRHKTARTLRACCT